MNETLIIFFGYPGVPEYLIDEVYTKDEIVSKNYIDKEELKGFEILSKTRISEDVKSVISIRIVNPYKNKTKEYIEPYQKKSRFIQHELLYLYYKIKLLTEEEYFNCLEEKLMLLQRPDELSYTEQYDNFNSKDRYSSLIRCKPFTTWTKKVNEKNVQ